jgi:hypothetical protein
MRTQEERDLEQNSARAKPKLAAGTEQDMSRKRGREDVGGRSAESEREEEAADWDWSGDVWSDARRGGRVVGIGFGLCA